MQIERDIKLDYSDVLLRPKRSRLGSRKNVELKRQYKFLNSGRTYEGIPIMAANMQGVGTFGMAEELIKVPMFTCLDKNYQPADIWDWLSNHVHKPDLCRNIAVTTGITDVDQERIDATLKLCRSIDYVCLDVANGYSERFLDYVARFREKYPNIVIIAGNVVTADITEELLLKGADIVKVVLVPVVFVLLGLRLALISHHRPHGMCRCPHGLGGHIIADGGCTSPGDVAKAFGAGADFVMLGGMMAGTKEGIGHEVRDGGSVEFFGSSTTVAQEESGGVQEHRTSEGRVVRIPYKGTVNDVVTDILGGLRSACTYVGADKLKNLSKCTTFVQVNGGKTYNPVYEGYQVSE